jgi:RNA polymerase sigma-70 factor (ECF subfamily)
MIRWALEVRWMLKSDVCFPKKRTVLGPHPVNTGARLQRRSNQENRESYVRSSGFRTPAQAAARAGDCADVRAAVAALPPEHREVIVLRYFDEMKLDEIARHLGLRVGTVKSRLHYASQKLRETLKHE